MRAGAPRVTRRILVYQPGVIFEDSSFPLTGLAIRGGIATVHPNFDPERLAHDVAVLTFPNGSFAGVEPIKVAKAGPGLTRRQLKLKAGPCFADSGSPQFLGDTNLVVSVFSDAGGECAGPFLSQRLDTRSERRFLAGFGQLS